MRKVILFIASSLDGYIAGPNGEIDWLFTDNDYGYHDFFSSIDTILMGRKTFDTIVELGDTSFWEKQCFVFTRSKRESNYPNVKFIDNDIVKFTRDIKNHKGNNIWLVGGGEINNIFLNNKLIDEIIISIHPVILGRGIPLFDSSMKETNLQLIKSVSFKSGLVQLSYSIKD